MAANAPSGSEPSAGAGSPSGSVEGIWSIDVDSGWPGVACARDHRGRRRVVRVELPVHRVGRHMDELAPAGDDCLAPSRTKLHPEAPAYDVEAGLVVTVVVPPARGAAV